MPRYALAHLSDNVLVRDLAALVARDRATTAELLAHIGEVDARQLDRPAAYPSMFAYCVGELRLSEDAAFKRIQAARAARRFPALFAALADGRLPLSGLVLLAPHLTEDTADELLAERFPRPDVLAWVEAMPGSSVPRGDNQQAGPVEEQVAPGQVEEQVAPGQLEPQLASGRAGDPPRVKPLSAQSFAIQFTLSRSAHDKLRYAQSLLGHVLPSGDIAAVVERALDALIPQLERGRFAATARPRAGGRESSASPRYVPVHVTRAVWERDGGQCTFESETGRRCPARTRLEFDHVEAVARGGEATVSGMRMRCRAHKSVRGRVLLRRRVHAPPASRGHRGARHPEGAGGGGSRAGPGRGRR